MIFQVHHRPSIATRRPSPSFRLWRDLFKSTSGSPGGHWWSSWRSSRWWSSDSSRGTRWTASWHTSPPRSCTTWPPRPSSRSTSFRALFCRWDTGISVLLMFKILTLNSSNYPLLWKFNQLNEMVSRISLFLIADRAGASGHTLLVFGLRGGFLFIFLDSWKVRQHCRYFPESTKNWYLKNSGSLEPRHWGWNNVPTASRRGTYLLFFRIFLFLHSYAISC